MRPGNGSPHARGDGPRCLEREGWVKLFSPRAWGWSAGRRMLQAGLFVLPTRVGMVRGPSQSPKSGQGSPHARGDGPFKLSYKNQTERFSPRAWGWSAAGGDNSAASVVLPTRVGMVRNVRLSSSVSLRSPHARGDGPVWQAKWIVAILFSPRAWGWSARLYNSFSCRLVLPTRVGMVRTATADASAFCRSPHARGDGPRSIASCSKWARFSPRAWGWSDGIR